MLKIYACSGIGAAQEAEEGYWLDNTRTESNTRAVNNLLSMINLRLAELNATTNQADRIAIYNDLDLQVVCLRLAQRYADNQEQLDRAGRVLSYYVGNGAFNYSSTDDTERSEHLETVYNLVVGDTDGSVDYPSNRDFLAWWEAEVSSLNKVGLTPAQQDALRSATSEGIGAVSGDISKYMSDCKTYFLYTYISDQDAASWPQIIQDRRKKQLEIKAYCAKVYRDISTVDAMERQIRISLLNTFGKQPEEVIAEIKAGKTKEGVGEAITMAVATVIAAAISAAVAIIAAILQCVATVSVAKYATPSDPDFGVPEPEDLDGVGSSISRTINEVTRTITSGNNLIIVAGAVALFFLLKKPKRKKRK